MLGGLCSPGRQAVFLTWNLALYIKLAVNHGGISIDFKVNRYPFRGSNSCHLHIFSPSQEGFTLKGKNLLLLEQILSCKSKPQFKKGYVSWWSKQEVKKVVPLSKNMGKLYMQEYPYTLF